MSRDPALLLDILLMARDAVGFIDGMDLEVFLNDRRTQYAVIRCLEVIGEVGRQVSQETRLELPDLPPLIAVLERRGLEELEGPG